MKRFTIDYYPGEELEKELLEDHDTINEANTWCTKNDICTDIILITEWDIDGSFDGQGIPEILESGNLSGVNEDGF